jgi:photosystem II stability/assembly factor-like uncharacterized protein
MFTLLLAVATSFAAVPAIAQQRPAQTPPDQRMEWYRQHAAMQDRSLFRHRPWQLLGPTNVSGRITDVAVVEPRGLSYTMYVAGATSGVWKTVNEGTTWEPVFQNAASTAIGDVTVSPSNPDIVWIGTGEANIFRSSNAGAGIYKSTDAGRTWTHMGLTGTYTIPRIVVHPTNPDIVWVASSGHEWTDNPERGVYRTTDGGRTWTRTLFISERTGAIDLAIDPTNPNALYASTWQRVRKKWNDPRNEPDYTGSGIHRSTDGGVTWTQINNGLPAARYRGRIGIDVSATNPNTLYAFVDNYEVARVAEAGRLNAYGLQMADVIKGATVYRSDDRGDSWRQVSQNNEYMEGLAGTYGWVFGQIRVDPTNVNRIYVMGLSLNVSDDGGRTFRRLTGMHGDHHGLWIDPANPDYLVNTNDGGVYVSYDGGENWRDFVDKLPFAQFFDVAYDMGEPFRVYGSMQDHGSYSGVVDLSRGRGSIPAVDFVSAPGGEGSTHVVDPRDPAIVYSAGFYGSLARTNIQTDSTVDIAPKPASGELAFRGQWLAPFILSPHDPNTIYHGFNYLFRSRDRGQTWDRISPDLTRNDRARLGDIPFQTIFAISESPMRAGVVYAGTDDGRIHVTRDGGANWNDVSGRLPQDRFVAELTASKWDEGTVYAVLNGKRDDDFAPYIYRSTDYGRSWTSIVNNIPSGPVNVIKEDPKNRTVLYVGTDLGVYASIDRGATWQELGDSLPTTYVHDLVVHPRDDIMVIATHGRGMFAMDVRPIQALTPDVIAQELRILPSEPMRITGGRGGGQARGEIHYWLKNAAEVTVVVKDNSGATVATLPATGDAGLNTAVWTAGGGGGRRGGGAGVATGIYSVVVTAGSATANGNIEVRRN